MPNRETFRREPWEKSAPRANNLDASTHREDAIHRPQVVRQGSQRWEGAQMEPDGCGIVGMPRSGCMGDGPRLHTPTRRFSLEM